MRNTMNFFGIIAIIAIIGCAMAACNSDVSDNIPVTSAPLGATLNLSGQVYELDYNTVSFKPSTGNLTVIAVYNTYDDDGYFIDPHPIGGNGNITAGQLAFSIGTPSHLVTISEIFEREFLYANNIITINHPEVQAVRLDLETPSGSWLRRSNSTVSGDYMTGFNIMGDDGDVVYIYVASDVTVSARRTSFSSVYNGFTWTETINAFNIHLKAGWNALHIMDVYTESATRATGTVTISAANPGNLRWELH